MLNGQSEYYPQEGAFEIYIGNIKLFSASLREDELCWFILFLGSLF